jgi:hypothetical protein
MKKIIRLTEGDLHRVIKASVRKILREDEINDDYYVDKFHDGLARVRKNSMWNFKDKDGIYISNIWFDFADDFHEGFARVQYKTMWNLINTDGDFISDYWFDNISDFKNGFATANLNGKRFEVFKDGEIYKK